MKIVLQGSIPSKKNSKQLFVNKRTGKSFITSSVAYKNWHRAMLYQLGAQKPILAYPVAVTCVFYMPSNRSTDLDNKFASIADLLQDAGIIENDDWQHLRPITLDVAGVDKGNPRCEIWLDEE